jgi:hypothetical protein
MLSLELKNLSEAPSILDHLNDQKVRSRVLAEIMPATYKTRMIKCCDWVAVRTFPNGHQKIAKTEFCRVRGCPVCDSCDYLKTMGKVAKTILRHRKMNPTAGLIILKTAPKSCEISTLKSTIADLSAAMESVYQRKVFPTNWMRLISVQASNNIFSVSCIFVLPSSPGAFGGRGYLSAAAWAKLFGCTIEKSRHSYADRQYMEPVAAVVKSSFLDFLSVPSGAVPDLVSAIKKQRFRSFSKEFRELGLTEKQVPNPSTVRQPLKSNVDYSVFVPDVLTHEYETELYLQTEEFDFEAALEDVQLELV